MEAKAFLQLARHLSSITDEAASRSAVSRAYYSAYHTGRAFLESLNFRIPASGKGHKRTHGCLMSSDDHDLRTAGSKLQDLYGQRIKADYYLNETRFTNQDIVRNLLEKAEEIIRLVEKDYSSKQPQICEAIKRYIANDEGKPFS